MYKAMKEIEFICHLMQQLGLLPEVKLPTSTLNDNQGSVNWIESGCKATKKLRQENISEFKIAEAGMYKYKKINIHWRFLAWHDQSSS